MRTQIRSIEISLLISVTNSLFTQTSARYYIYNELHYIYNLVHIIFNFSM